MKRLWIIIILLPALIVPSLFFGFELPLYLSLAVIGLILWLYSEDPLLNLIGSQVARAGFILFILAFMYYFFSGSFLVSKPFEFRFLRVFIEYSVRFLIDIGRFIGSVVLGIFSLVIK